MNIMFPMCFRYVMYIMRIMCFRYIMLFMEY